jgi:hypothetical protein
VLQTFADVLLRSRLLYTQIYLHSLKQ